MKIGVIGDEDTIALLKLAGASEFASNIEKFDEMVRNEELAILIITDEFAEKLREKIVMHRLQKEFPFIVEIPGKKKVEKEDTIKKIIVRAVGVEVG